MEDAGIVAGRPCFQAPVPGSMHADAARLAATVGEHANPIAPSRHASCASAHDAFTLAPALHAGVSLIANAVDAPSVIAYAHNSSIVSASAVDAPLARSE